MYKFYSILMISLLVVLGCDETTNSVSVTPDKTISEVEADNGFNEGELIDSLNANGCLVYGSTTVSEFNETYPNVLPEESNGTIVITFEDMQGFEGCFETTSPSSSNVDENTSSSSSNVEENTSSSQLTVDVHPNLIRDYEVRPDSDDVVLYTCMYEKYGKARATVRFQDELGSIRLEGNDHVNFNASECEFTSVRTETILLKEENAEWSELQFFDNNVSLDFIQQNGLDSVSIVLYVARNRSINGKVMVTINDIVDYDQINLTTNLIVDEDYVGPVNFTFAISDLKLSPDHPNYNTTSQNGYDPIVSNSNTLERINVRFIDTNPDNGEIHMRIEHVFLH